jgi:ankyrin repeat protein
MNPWRAAYRDRDFRLQAFHWVGDLRLVVEKGRVTCFKGLNPKPLWTTLAPANSSAEASMTPGWYLLEWLTDDGDTAYFRAREVQPPRVRRLKLANGEWLADLPCASAGPEGYVPYAITRVLPGDGFVVVLGSVIKRSTKETGTASWLYSVACYKVGAGSPIWSRNFPAKDDPAWPSEQIQPLAWMADMLLVCPQETGPIYCLNADTGTLLWSLERPWEFEAAHVIGNVGGVRDLLSRFGLRDEFISSSQYEKAVVDARKAFDNQCECRIVGGPHVLPVNFRRGSTDPDSHSFFLAVSRTTHRPASNSAFSDCILYEFNDRGKGIALAKLRDEIRGYSFGRVPGGIIWECEDGSLLKTIAYRDLDPHKSAQRSPLMELTVPWSRQPSRFEPESSRIKNRLSDADVAAFGQKLAVHICTTGYILSGDPSHFRFQLFAVDLQTGRERKLILRVPFGAEVSEVAYGLEITHLRLDGNILEIALGLDKWSGGLRFDLGTADALHEADTGPSARELARARVGLLSGNLEQQDAKSGDTPLIEGINQLDSDYVAALLDAGAKIEGKSKYGWTPLMAAAHDSSLQLVKLLLKAGANVHARDSDGKTALLHAASSARESKAKLKALLAAGADITVKDRHGLDILMFACYPGGNVPAIEFLLAKNVSVTRRNNDGCTALIYAATDSNPAVAALLLKAGADVNARGTDGRTTLMSAVTGAGTIDTIRILLEAGADPSLKDDSGLTALDMVRKYDDEEARLMAKMLSEAEKKRQKPP